VKPAHLRPLAKADLSDQAWYYAHEASALVANDFVDHALAALGVIEQQPGIGSPRWNEPGTVPTLRAWRVGRFPAIWLYFEREDHVDVVRLLGERQDIPALLRGGFD
jgi:toxin ParE1/3/4